MTQLNLENLEGRALMSANVVGALAAPAGADVAVVRVVDSNDVPNRNAFMDFSEVPISNLAPAAGNRVNFAGDGFEAPIREWYPAR